MLTHKLNFIVICEKCHRRTVATLEEVRPEGESTDFIFWVPAKCLCQEGK